MTIRSATVFSLVAFGCFAAGWSIARLMGSTPEGSPAQVAHAAGSDGQAAPLPVETSQAAGLAAGEWKAALEKFRGGSWANSSEPHALMAAILRMNAADFPASAEGILEAFSREKGEYADKSQTLADAWLDRWLEVDAAGALRFLKTSPFFSKLPTEQLDVDDGSSSAFGGIFQALARKQPDWLQAYLKGLPEGAARRVGVSTLLMQLAHTDAGKARRFLAGLAEGKERDAAMSGFLQGLSRVDPNAAFDFAFTEPAGSQRFAQLRAVFYNSGSRGLPFLKGFLDRVTDPEERRQLAQTALAAVAYNGGSELLPFVKEECARIVSELGEKADFGQWAYVVRTASSGPQAKAFAEWAIEFSAGKNNNFFSSIAQGWAQQSPKEFAAWIVERAASSNAEQMKQLEKAGSALNYSLEAIRLLADTLPPGPLRDQVRFQAAINAAGKGDISQAVEAYRSLAATDLDGKRAVRLATVLVGKDGVAAAEWATQQPPGKARDAALRVVAETWCLRDVNGSAQWIASLPAGLERDRMMKTYATTVVVADAPAAAEWVSQVADPQLRAQTAKTVFDRWRIQDPIAARAWLGQQPGGLLEKFMRNAE